MSERVISVVAALIRDGEGRVLLAGDAAGHPYANARRLGIMYIIWNNQIWGSYRAGEGWRAYGQCAAHPEPGYDASCHRDHIHFSLSWAGAQGRTSFWTRSVAAPDYGPPEEDSRRRWRKS